MCLEDVAVVLPYKLSNGYNKKLSVKIASDIKCLRAERMTTTELMIRYFCYM